MYKTDQLLVVEIDPAKASWNSVVTAPRLWTKADQTGDIFCYWNWNFFFFIAEPFHKKKKPSPKYAYVTSI